MAGRNVLITGGSRGLGFGIAEVFAKQGERIVLLARNQQRLRQAVCDLKASGTEARGFVCDIQDPDAVKRCMAQIEQDFGTIDVLVNNAMHYVCSTLERMDPVDWNRQIAVGLNGAFYCIRFLLPGMMARGRGHIVNIASSAAIYPIATFSAYAAAKAGMIAMTKTLAEEVKNHEIHVNAVVLGMTDTDKTRERIGRESAVTIGLDQMITVREAAEVVRFLASQEASAIRGSAIEVFGKQA